MRCNFSGLRCFRFRARAKNLLVLPWRVFECVRAFFFFFFCSVCVYGFSRGRIARGWFLVAYRMRSIRLKDRFSKFLSIEKYNGRDRRENRGKIEEICETTIFANDRFGYFYYDSKKEKPQGLDMFTKCLSKLDAVSFLNSFTPFLGYLQTFQILKVFFLIIFKFVFWWGN